MKRRSTFTTLVIAALAGALTACATTAVHREIVFTPADGSTAGRFVFPGGVNSGEAALDMAGRHFVGEWVFVAGGGGTQRTIAIVPTSDGPRAVTAVHRMQASSGSGRFNLRSSDGLTVQCEFDFSFDSGTGAGSCRDNQGRNYSAIMVTVVGRPDVASRTR